MQLRQLNKRFLLNASAQSYAQAISIAIQFIQIPLFLRFWGVEKYGEWIVLAGIPLALSVLDLGITQASASKSAMEAGARDWSASRDTLAGARFYALGLGVSVVLFVLWSTFLIDWSRLLKISHCDRFSCSAVLVILTAALAVGLRVGSLDAWMRAYGEAALSGFIAASTRLVELLVAAVLLILGFGFLGIAAGYLASAIAVCALHAFIARARAPEELRRLGAFRAADLRKVVRPASGFIALSLTQTLMIQGGVQVLNQLTAPPQVVVFTMARTLMRLILNIGIVINLALRPEVSLLIGAGQQAVAERFVWKSWKFALVAGSILYLVLVAAGPQFILFWSDSKIHPSHALLAFIGVHALLGIVWLIPATMQMAGNAHARSAFYYSLSACLALCLWLLLSRTIDPFVGAALLLAIPELIMVLCLLIRSREKLPIFQSQAE